MARLIGHIIIAFGLKYPSGLIALFGFRCPTNEVISSSILFSVHKDKGGNSLSSYDKLTLLRKEIIKKFCIFGTIKNEIIANKKRWDFRSPTLVHNLIIFQ